MSRKVILVVLLTFGLFDFGFGQTKKQKRAKIPTVNFCELTTNPAKYADKIIRTEANYLVWWESSYLYGDTCNSSEHKVHNESDCDPSDETCVKKFSAEWKKLEPYMRSKRNDNGGISRVKAVFVGRFVGPDSYGHLGSFEYELRIQKVEKVKAIPKRVSW